MTNKQALNLAVGHIPVNHTVVGYIASVKVLDESGNAYYALRTDGLPDMEMLGMAVSMGDDFRRQMLGGTNPVDEDRS